MPSSEHRPHPRQVVQPDLVDEHALRLDAEQARDRALEPDRDVAEADGAVTRIEQRPRDDPDRVREVDDPGVRRPRARAPGRRSTAPREPCAAPWRGLRRRSSPGRRSRTRAAPSRRRAAPAGRRRGSGRARSRPRRARGRDRPSASERPRTRRARASVLRARRRLPAAPGRCPAGRARVTSSRPRSPASPDTSSGV